MTKSSIVPVKVLSKEALEAVKAIFIGFEASNGHCKITSNLNVQVPAYLNTIIESDKESYEGSKGVMEGTLKEVFEVQLEGETKPSYWKVGLTNGEGLDFFADDDEDKYSNPKWHVVNAILLYKLLRHVPESADLPVCGVSGMPTNHSEKPKCKQDLIQGLSQRFKVNGRVIQFTSLADQPGIATIPQGDGGFWNNVVSDDDVNELNEVFLNETAGSTEEESSVVAEYDLGFLTGDIKVAIDYTISPKLRKQVDGIQQQWAKIIDLAKEKNDAFVGVDPILLDKQLAQGAELSIDNGREKVNVKTERRDVLQAYAKYLCEALTKHPFSKTKFTQVRFTGGASIFMEPFIMEYLTEKYKDNPAHLETFVFEKDAQLSNVKGFQKMCERKYSKLLS